MSFKMINVIFQTRTIHMRTKNNGFKKKAQEVDDTLVKKKTYNNH